jgi:hypothetical protein
MNTTAGWLGPPAFGMNVLEVQVNAGKFESGVGDAGVVGVDEAGVDDALAVGVVCTPGPAFDCLRFSGFPTNSTPTMTSAIRHAATAAIQ